MRIGYAPGRCLRAWLMSLGYPLPYLQQAGVVTPEGFDTFTHRVVFPLDGNLYGRSIRKAAPHQFLPGGKGGLYGMGESSGMSGDHSGRGIVRSGRAVAGGLSQRHLFDGDLS